MVANLVIAALLAGVVLLPFGIHAAALSELESEIAPPEPGRPLPTGARQDAIDDDCRSAVMLPNRPAPTKDTWMRRMRKTIDSYTAPAAAPPMSAIVDCLRPSKAAR